MRLDPLTSYGRQALDEMDVQAVVEALRGQYLTGGPVVRDFELALERMTGAAHAVSCGNCTQGLHLAAQVLGAGLETSVIVPSVTFLATANAPESLGADIVFADVDPESGLMQPEHFEEAIRRCSSRPVSVMPVHLAGQVADIKAIQDIAGHHGIKVIEDAAHAIGTVYESNGKICKVGDCSFSDATVFSFHPVKNMTTGEGGAVLVKDGDMASKLKRLRSHGMVREADQFVGGSMGFDENGNANPWYYEMAVPGYNYRLTDIQAALGISQLAKLEKFVEKRLRLKKRYDELLLPYADIVRPIKVSGNCKPAWHLYIVLIDYARLGKERSHVMKSLLKNGIASQVHYIPVHKQPYYKAKNPDLQLSGAEEYYARTLTLPLHVSMEEGHVEKVVDTLVEILGRK